MVHRFCMVAGPNGSGKSTLVALLRSDYAVNFYTMLNADNVFAEASRSLVYVPPFPLDADSLADYVRTSSYPAETKGPFESGGISVQGDMIRFASRACVTSYTVAMLMEFLQREHLSRGLSFSQETVFSHPSKVAALAEAHAKGYRTYLYFVTTNDLSINRSRIANRVASGGHAVPDEKVFSRAKRCYDNVRAALPFLSRAYFFDNSYSNMRLVAEYSDGAGIEAYSEALPDWLAKLKPGV